MPNGFRRRRAGGMAANAFQTSNPKIFAGGDDRW